MALSVTNTEGFLDYTVFPQRENLNCYERFVNRQLAQWSLTCVSFLNQGLNLIQGIAALRLHSLFVLPRLRVTWLRNSFYLVSVVVNTVLIAFQTKIIHKLCSFFTEEVKRIEMAKLEDNLKAFVLAVDRESPGRILVLSSQQIHDMHFDDQDSWNIGVIHSSEGGRQVYIGPLDKIALDGRESIAIGVDEMGRSIIALRLKDPTPFKLTITLSKEEGFAVHLSDSEGNWGRLPLKLLSSYQLIKTLNGITQGKGSLSFAELLPISGKSVYRLDTIPEGGESDLSDDELDNNPLS